MVTVKRVKGNRRSSRRETELNEALQADRATRSEALQRGLSATQPLSVARLAELCEVGERMQATAARVQRATDDLTEDRSGSDLEQGRCRPAGNC